MRRTRKGLIERVKLDYAVSGNLLPIVGMTVRRKDGVVRVCWRKRPRIRIIHGLKEKKRLCDDHENSPTINCVGCLWFKYLNIAQKCCYFVALIVYRCSEPLERMLLEV